MSATLKNAPAPAPPGTGGRTAAAQILALLRRALPAGVRPYDLLWQGAAAMAGLFLAAGRVYGGTAPFGLALVLGCAPGSMPAAAAGALIGSLLFQPPGLALALAAALLAAVAARTARPGPLLPAFAVAGTALLLAHLATWLWRGPALPGLVQAAGTAVLAAALAVGIRLLPARSLHGACLWLAMAAACAQRAAPFGLAPGLALAVLAGLGAACCAGLEQSALLAAVLAVAVAAASPAQGAGALAAALGILAAAAFGQGRRGPCAALFAAGALLGLVPAGLPLAPMASIGAGLLLFALVPVAAWGALFPAQTGAGDAAAEGVPGAAVAERLDSLAKALTDVADTVNAVCERQLPPRGETFDFVVDYTVRRLCQGCPQREHCWIRSYSGTMDGLYHLKPPLEARGRLEIEDLKGPLSACVRPAELCLTVGHGYHLWRSRRQSRAQATVLRTALTDQYAAMAGALAQLAGQLGQCGLPDPRQEARVAQLFADNGLQALSCQVRADLWGRLCASVTVARADFAPDGLAALAQALRQACRRDFALPEVRHRHAVTTLTFAERPMYRAEFGAANRPADGQGVSGDAYDHFCDAAGRAQLLLCDGMGAGRAAAVDGQMAARLAAQLLQAGLAAEGTARLVNVALGLKNSELESGATLDLATVDLYTGRAASYKAGAAPSFLLRGGVPRALEGAGLPIGVLDRVVGRAAAWDLQEGDMLVLVSDGVLADGSDWLQQQLALCARLGYGAAQVAQAVVDGAAKRPGGGRDDCTALALQLLRA